MCVCVCDLGEVFVNLRKNIIPDSNMRIRSAFSLGHIMNFRVRCKYILGHFNTENSIVSL